MSANSGKLPSAWEKGSRLRCGILRLMQVQVRYLGMLKDLAGRDGESVEVAEDAPLGDLYAKLLERIPQLVEFRHAIALAVNYEYSNAETQLREGDEVALIPPVSGALRSSPPPSAVLNCGQPNTQPLCGIL